MRKFFICALTISFFALSLSLPVSAVDEATSTARAVRPTPVPDVIVGAPPEFLFPGMLPDHPLYFLKDLYYKIRTALVFGDRDQAEWYLKLADKRAAEARELAKKGRLTLATQAARKADAMHQKAVEKIKAIGIDQAPEDLMKQLEDATMRQQVTLEDLKSRLPPDATAPVADALDKITGRVNTLLGKKADSESPSGEPDNPTPSPLPGDKLSEELRQEIEQDPERSLEVQIHLNRVPTEEEKTLIEHFLEITSYTEKFAVGEATSGAILRTAELPIVSNISFLPKAK